MSKLYNGFARVSVIMSGADLLDAKRKAADYDNSTNLAPYGHFFLVVQYNTSAPAAGVKVAELYILPEDGSAGYPVGGDGTVGWDYDPQESLLVGSFVTRAASTTATETLVVPWVALSPKMRVVLKNTSGKTFEGATPNYFLYMKPLKRVAD